MVGVVQFANFSDFKCDIPELNGGNWKERVLLHLGWMDVDYAIRKDGSAGIIETSKPDAVDLYEKWERSNCLFVMLIKTKIFAGICGSIEHHEKVKDLIKAIDEQFATSDKALASTLIIKFSTMKLTGVRGVRDHIMRIRDIAAQLKDLEVTMSDSFLVHYILCTLPHQYVPFKLSYNTHKDNRSISELLTMSVLKKERLMMEEGERVNLGVQGEKKKEFARNKGNIPPQPIIKKEFKCFFCKRKGSMKKDCLKFKTWLDKKGYAKPKEASGM